MPLKVVNDFSTIFFYPYHLYLNNTPVSDLKPLAELNGLFYLGLNNTHVSDLTALAGMKSLQVLNLEITRVTKEQNDALQRALPNCRIEWSPPDKAIEGE